ncbi:SlyX protein [Neorhodopirellula lusitana]|uniref:SlyX protein n=1 Tax=Neorhodopirellula lusitana TaxID=445327 RepID=A0ABY1QA71_9BACT|nr:SlyX family protein [Neorhodopirellula lusitana]SMP65240.1 SlyX protein [Neorhodopirellula lusitana]
MSSPSTPSTQPIEDRVTKLEIQLAHTERICEQLNEVVTQLSRDAQERDRLLKRIVEQLKDVKNKMDESGTAEDEKPPHY